MGLFGSFVAFSLMAACACRRWRMRDGESHGAMCIQCGRYMLEIYAICSSYMRCVSRIEQNRTQNRTEQSRIEQNRIQ